VGMWNVHNFKLFKRFLIMIIYAHIICHRKASLVLANNREKLNKQSPPIVCGNYWEGEVT